MNLVTTIKTIFFGMILYAQPMAYAVQPLDVVQCKAIVDAIKTDESLLKNYKFEDLYRTLCWYREGVVRPSFVDLAPTRDEICFMSLRAFIGPNFTFNLQLACSTKAWLSENWNTLNGLYLDRLKFYKEIEIARPDLHISFYMLRAIKAIDEYVDNPCSNIFG